ncbi:MAG: protein-export chaperone SecB [Alphaproteobacteria bacterium]|nr:protein-export chaperone SecB [Alphaproteobacteria bacterium]MBV9860803.1 protein-export chaperone SecB [Alphaproteobacteria bacterium]
MADEARGNGQGGDAPAALPEQQQLIVNAQYVQDLSFENPRAPQTLMQPAGQPSVEVNVDVKARNLGPELYEVVLTIGATAKAGADTVFLVELAYGAVVTIRNVPEPMLGPLILVETPRLMFPFARAIIANATRDGGFPPLMINPIDFGELLRRQQQNAPAAPGTASI